MDDRYLRIKDLSKMLSIGNSTIYRLVKPNIIDQAKQLCDLKQWRCS